MLNRKVLPGFGYIKDFKVDTEKLVKHCQAEGLFNFNLYNDIKVSSNSKMSSFVKENAFSKVNFFSEAGTDYLEGEKYKQLYLTELKRDVKSTNSINGHSIFNRTKRLKPESHHYSAVADELNYGKRNHLVKGIFEEILDQFQGDVKRVRLAYLSPQFKILPHIDYDPSYITRFHIPIVTNPLCTIHVVRQNEESFCHWPADGKVYFLNTGLKHWAQNSSNEPRLHLIIDTHGQQDFVRGLVPLEGHSQSRPFESVNL